MGMEGMGPEHSSARPERFLQMCSDDPEYFPPEDEQFTIQQLININMIVANCSTPANYFHILRRQIALPFRKPLRVITEAGPPAANPAEISKVLFCTGKVYYDLIKERRERGLEDKIAIHTIEQISPFPFDIMKKVTDEYSNAELFWVQEEHKNMGAWSYVQPRTQTAVGGYHRLLQYIGRDTAPSPATGSKASHKKELSAFLDKAMAL